MTEWGIDTLFNPGKRHLDEEKRRLQSTREEIGDSSGGRRIDLESGTVVINRKKASASPADESDELDETQPAVADEGAADDDNGEAADNQGKATGQQGEATDQEPSAE
jgi:hypothetical protein